MFGMFKGMMPGKGGKEKEQSGDDGNSLREAEMVALQNMASREPSQAEQDDIYNRVVGDVRAQTAAPPPASTTGTPGQRAPQDDQDDIIRRALDSFRQDPPPSYNYQGTPVGPNPFATQPPMRRRGY